MILVDTSIWTDHLRKSEQRLTGLLNSGQILMHPLIIGEVAMGNFARRDQILRDLRDLRVAIVAEDDEVLELISERHLFGRGIGYIDAHLLAAVRLTPHAFMWTRDKRLLEIAQELGLAAGEN